MDNNHFCITSHINLDGDAIGSELAFFHFLKMLKKDAIIINQDRLPEVYRFLPGSENCMNIKTTGQDIIKNKHNFIILDSSNLDRIGEINLSLKADYLINIDHHCSNDLFGTINCLDTNASSTGEIIFDFINHVKPESIDKKIATCLFTAIITDTGAFRYENTSEKTFRITSKLVATGIKPHVISQNIYNKKSFNELKLLGLALSNIEKDKTNFVTWVTINRRMLEKTNTKDENTEGIIEMISTLEESEVFVLFRETENDSIKISLRSKGHFNVNEFAAKFNGGGHPNAAGCTCPGKLKDVKDKLLSNLLNKKYH